MAGRPSKFSDNIVKKLEEAFAWDCPIEEACFYAGISKRTYYSYLEQHPELVERFEALRAEPVLKARETVVKKLTDNYSNAMDYLSRKRKSEFASRQEVTGADGQALFDDETKKQSKEAIGAFVDGDSRPGA